MKINTLLADHVNVSWDLLHAGSGHMVARKLAATSSPHHVASYLTGGPISSHREAVNADGVTFMARRGMRIGGEQRRVSITLSLREFASHWCLHIQPAP